MSSRFLLRVASVSRTAAMLIGLATYLGIAAAFGTVYRLAHLLRSGPMPANAGEAYYFSLVNQATVGFGDILPTRGIGQAAASLQITIGMMWTVLVPALVVYRLLRPSPGDLKIADRLVFYPSFRSFVFMVEANGGVEVRITDVRGTLTAQDPDASWVDVRLISTAVSTEKKQVLNAGEVVGVFLDKVGPEPSSNNPLRLHPAHIAPDSVVEVRVEGSTPLGPLLASARFDRRHIECKVWTEGRSLALWLKDMGSFRAAKCDPCPFNSNCQLRIPPL